MWTLSQILRFQSVNFEVMRGEWMGIPYLTEKQECRMLQLKGSVALTKKHLIEIWRASGKVMQLKKQRDYSLQLNSPSSTRVSMSVQSVSS
jgi:hypothetical protein